MTDAPPAPRPPRRVRAAALLVGGGAAFSALFLADEYGVLPPEVGGPFAPLGPPSRIIVVLGVFVEGLLAAYLFGTATHPLERPIMTHYGGRALACGATAIAGGFVVYALWAQAGVFLPEPHLFFEAAILTLLVGGAFLLSALSVLGSALLAPWLGREES